MLTVAVAPRTQQLARLMRLVDQRTQCKNKKNRTKQTAKCDGTVLCEATLH